MADLVSDEGLFFIDAILPLHLREEKEASRFLSISLIRALGSVPQIPPPTHTQSYVLNAYSETDPVGEGLEPLGHGASLGGSGPLGVALEVVPSPRSCMALLSVYGEIKQLSLAHSPDATDIQLMDQASMD